MLSVARVLFQESARSSLRVKKQFLVNSLAVLGAGIGGSLLYDQLCRKNLDILSSALSWDAEWDRFVGVSPEMHEDIKEWFIPADRAIVDDREKYDTENEIGIRDIILVRHGQYGREGSLTDLGKDQARMTADRLRDILKGRKIRKIFHSELPRAKETAIEIAKLFPDLDVVETKLLNEGVPAPVDPPSTACPPYLPEDGERMEKAFRSFFARPLGGDNSSVDILVGHGNCFRFFMCRALQIDPRFWLRMSIYNCGLSWIEIDSNGRVSARSVGDTGHIPASKLSYS